MENRCLEFYRESAGRNLDAEGKKFFEQMILQEETHIAELTTGLEELVNKEKDLDRAPVFLHFNAYDLDALLPDLSMHEVGGSYRLNAQDAMELVLAINDKTAEYFKAYANRFAETQGKRVLLEFVEQERTHGERIRQRKQEG
jgi:rubrerythrin